MKKIGIVGGVAWLSTVEYYSELCRRAESRHKGPADPPSMPEMSIESLDHSRAVSYLGRNGDEDSWLQFDEYHRAALQRLQASGADFAIMASNTPHHRFATITRGIAIPVIDMFDVAAQECVRIGASSVVVLGTTVTMASSSMRRAFAARQVEACGPRRRRDRDAIIELIAKLQRGQTEGAAELLGNIAGAAFAEQFSGPPVVLLACTELPLAFPETKRLTVFDIDRIRYLSSSAIHIDAAFRMAARE
jgi:aspartate racemase